MYDELTKSIRHCVATMNCVTCPIDSIDKTAKAQQRCVTLMLAQSADAIEELKTKLNHADEQIEKLVEAAEGRRWIPVTERLPECECGAEVGNIEWISWGRVFAGCFGRGGKYRDAYFRTWTDGTEGIDAKNADYWRAVTLPEPTQEET